MIYSIKTNKSYCRINIPEPDISNANLIDIWFYLCKINAFTRVYYIFMKKKKINILTLAQFFVFYTLYIPFKLLKLAYYFLTSKNNFRTSLIFLTLDSYNRIRDLQIEVLNKKVYLNCNNLTKLSKLIIKNNSLIDRQTFCRGMQKLQNASRDFSRKEEAYGRLEVELRMIYDENDRPYSKVPHYTVVENNTSLHATSNVRNLNLFSSNQRIDGIIPSLVRAGAIEPGSVITKGVSRIKTIPNKSLWVPTSELNVIKANHEEFAVDNNIRNYQKEKEETYIEILGEDFKFGKKINGDLLRGLRYNEFARDLNNADSTRLENEYDEIYRELRENRNEI